MMNILLLSRYERMGASSRVRSYQYLSYLRDQGMFITVAPLLSNRYLEARNEGSRINLMDIICAYTKRVVYLLKAHQFDCLWVEKEALPWFPAVIEFTAGLRKVSYLVDYDDAWFHRYDLHPASLIRLALGKKIDKIMASASLVVAGNEYLADRAAQAGARRVEILPSVVNHQYYTPRLLSKSAVFTIGWIGSFSTVGYLRLIEDPLKEVCKAGDARIVVMGANGFEIGGLPVKTVSWSEEMEVACIQEFDVGVMPLPDEPWERGKCGYKLIQYMACGLPVVASPVGVNRDIIEDGVNGFYAETHEDWVRALTRLKEDTALRHAMGQKGREKVKKQYSLQVTAPRLVQLLRSVASAR